MPKTYEVGPELNYRDGVEAERERCAKIAEAIGRITVGSAAELGPLIAAKVREGK